MSRIISLDILKLQQTCNCPERQVKERHEFPKGFEAPDLVPMSYLIAESCLFFVLFAKLSRQFPWESHWANEGCEVKRIMSHRVSETILLVPIFYVNLTGKFSPKLKKGV